MKPIWIWFQSAEIKANVIKYFKEIADVLAYVNRQMILIFKTNDLLRGIESSLGTKNSMSTFIQVDKYYNSITLNQNGTITDVPCLFQSYSGERKPRIYLCFCQVHFLGSLVTNDLKCTSFKKMARQNEGEVGPVQNLLLRVIPVPLLVQTRLSSAAEMIAAVLHDAVC